MYYNHTMVDYGSLWMHHIVQKCFLKMWVHKKLKSVDPPYLLEAVTVKVFFPPKGTPEKI